MSLKEIKAIQSPPMLILRLPLVLDDAIVHIIMPHVQMVRFIVE